MRGTGLGRVLFGLSFAVLGVLSIALPDFAKTWPLVPKDFAFHDALALLAAVILVLSSIGLLLPRFATGAALVLICLLALLFAQQIPGVVAQPLVEGKWYNASEYLTFVAGAWTILSTLRYARFGNARLGQILFGLALPAIGLAHLFYLDLTVPLVPAWLPFPVAIAYMTGAAHIAAGIAILTGVLAHLAAVLEAIMVSLFTLLVWVPMVIAAPTVPFNLSEICVSTAISGAAWAVAGSFRRHR